MRQTWAQNIWPPWGGGLISERQVPPSPRLFSWPSLRATLSQEHSSHRGLAMLWAFLQQLQFPITMDSTLNFTKKLPLTVSQHLLSCTSVQ